MKTIVFKDPLNHCVWFKLGEKLMTAPVQLRQNVFCPGESGIPDLMPKYVQDYIEQLLQDEDMQRNYAGMEITAFFEVSTAKLEQMIADNSDDIIILTDQEWD